MKRQSMHILSSTEEKMSCPVCVEPFNKTTRGEVVCPKCDYGNCRTCVRRYLLSLKGSPQCMNCQFEWTRSFLTANLPRSFINGEYRRHRARLLADTEKARLAEDIEAAARVKAVPALRIESNELRDEIRRLRAKINQNDEEIWRCKQIMAGNDDDKKKAAEKREFLQGCPVDGCNGMLSTHWRCKICETYVCRNCTAVKGKVPPGVKPVFAFPDHVCKEADVKSAAFLRKDTKPCPSCGSRIHRISGCNQMWCTACNTPFDWMSGAVIRHGIFHNPHFVQYQRAQARLGQQMEEGGGGAGANALCGRLPTRYEMRTAMATWRRRCAAPPSVRQHLEDLVRDLLRNLGHFRETILRPLQRRQQRQTNRDLRIRFILSKISEDELETMVSRRALVRDKESDILHVYELVDTVLRESVLYIYNNMVGAAGPGGENGRETQQNVERIRRYANGELKRISVTYGQSVGLLSSSFHQIAAKYTKKRLTQEQDGEQLGLPATT